MACQPSCRLTRSDMLFWSDGAGSQTLWMQLRKQLRRRLIPSFPARRRFRLLRPCCAQSRCVCRPTFPKTLRIVGRSALTTSLTLGQQQHCSSSTYASVPPWCVVMMLMHDYIACCCWFVDAGPFSGFGGDGCCSQAGAGSTARLDESALLMQLCLRMYSQPFIEYDCPFVAEIRQLLAMPAKFHLSCTVQPPCSWAQPRTLPSASLPS